MKTVKCSQHVAQLKVNIYKCLLLCYIITGWKGHRMEICTNRIMVNVYRTRMLRCSAI